MKIWKLFLAAALLAVAGCTQAPTNFEDNNHAGCAEGEMVNGSCQATNGNTEVFIDGTYEIISENVVSGEASGYLTRPAKEGQYPGVIMIHEWWGLNDNIKRMADILASHGYAVYSIDLYDGEVATTSDKAGELAGSVRSNQQEAIGKMLEAGQYLRRQEYTTESLGSIGWCFGGGESLELALNAESMNGTVLYYGSVTDNEEELSNIKWPVLGIFGAEDGSIPPEDVRAFETSLNNLGIENDITIYDGVGHAFANPSGSGFSPEESEDAWNKTIAFLEKNLK